MTREIINTGTIPNDNTGDSLRDAFIKTNDNFTDLYNVLGYANYQDDATSTLIFNTTPKKLSINKLGASTYEAKLPLAIRGSGTLWNGASFITPINEGDAYDLRITFKINAKSGAPNFINVVLDIGGGATPTNVVVELTENIVKTPPYSQTITFPIFCRSTFLANGGQMFISTDTGTIDVTERAIFIKRDFDGNL